MGFDSFELLSSRIVAAQLRAASAAGLAVRGF